MGDNFSEFQKMGSFLEMTAALTRSADVLGGNSTTATN